MTPRAHELDVAYAVLNGDEGHTFNSPFFIELNEDQTATQQIVESPDLPEGTHHSGTRNR